MNKIVIYVTLLLSLVAIGMGAWMFKNRERTAFVLLSTLYNKFEMSKEMNAKYEAVALKRNSLLDSIRYSVMVAERQKSKDLEYYKQLFYYKSEEFEKSNRQVKDQYDEQVWKQINQYINDYGKENGYKYIYGATGNGSLMYGDEGVNITDEIAEYINNKYKGKK